MLKRKRLAWIMLSLTYVTPAKIRAAIWMTAKKRKIRPISFDAQAIPSRLRKIHSRSANGIGAVNVSHIHMGQLAGS